MRYEAPELVVVGTAGLLVRGDLLGCFDHVNSDTSQPPTGLALGLDE